MSLFIDKHNRRKSPIALAAFGAALAFLCVFIAASLLLAEPLYRFVSLGSETASTVVHATVIAVVGTAVCCLTFLLKDKRVAPYGFAGLAVILFMFYAAAMSLGEESRNWTLRFVSMFGLAPVVVGNAVTWPIYLKMKRANPALNHRKTIQEELREALEKQPAKRQPADPVPTAPEQPVCTPEEAMFGPEAASPVPPSFRSAQEEAMLLYEDDDEEIDD